VAWFHQVGTDEQTGEVELLGVTHCITLLKVTMVLSQKTFYNPQYSGGCSLNPTELTSAQFRYTIQQGKYKSS